MSPTYDNAALAKALGHKFPMKTTGFCTVKQCRNKNFMWVKKDANQLAPTLCPAHQKEKEEARVAQAGFKPRTLNFVCAPCGKQYRWSKQRFDMKPPRFCPKHDPKVKQPKPVCPTTQKPKFATRQEAQEYRDRRMYDYGKVLYVYPCSCTGWHITSKIKKNKAKYQ